MRLLVDMNISPETVAYLRTLGHDAIRVSEVLAPSAPDATVVAHAVRDNRVVLTQDLDFSALIALSGGVAPSAITLRLSSSRIALVHNVLQQTLPALEEDVKSGCLVTIEDHATRRRFLPIT